MSSNLRKINLLAYLPEFLLVILFWIIGQFASNLSITFIFVAVLSLIYGVYILTRTPLDCCRHVIALTVFQYFVVSMAHRWHLGHESIDFMYVIDIILIFSLIKVIIIQIQKGVFRWYLDKALIFISLLVFAGLIQGILNGASLYNLLISLFIYCRLLPVYLIIVFGHEDFNKSDLVTFFVANLLPVPLELINYADGQDDIAGLLGFSGNTMFGLLAIMFLVYFAFDAFKGIGSYRSFVVALVIFFLWCAIGENKVQLLIGLLSVLLVVLLVRRKSARRFSLDPRKLGTLLLLPLMIVLGIILLLHLHPEWTYITRIGLRRFWEQYTQKANVSYYQIGRLQVPSYIFSVVLTTFSKKMFGVGIGNGQPGLLARFTVYDNNSGVRSNFHEILNTSFFSENGVGLGYHNSGTGILLLECGILGMVLYFAMLLVFFLRALRLLRIEQYQKVGILGLAFLISWVAISTFYNPIFEVRGQLIFFVVVGILSRTSRKADSINLFSETSYKEKF